jgi:hypothetical protein
MRAPRPPPAGVDVRSPWRTKEPLIVPDLTGASRLPDALTVLEEALQGAQRVSCSFIALAAGLALFPGAAHAHDRWDNGEPVPAWVKTECCGPKDAHHLRPDQVRRNADGDYVVDIYPDPIPAHIALPSQDGDYWLFFYNDYGFYGSARCFFVPALF